MEKAPGPKGKGKTLKCPYSQCYLSDTHHHEVFQIIFLFVGILILANSPDQLSLPIFLFSAPVFVDTFFFVANCKKVRNLKIFLLVFSGLFTLSYFLCVSNVIIEEKSAFVFNSKNAILGPLSVIPIPKNIVCYCLLPLIISPALSWIGSRGQSTRAVSEVAEMAKSA